MRRCMTVLLIAVMTAPASAVADPPARLRVALDRTPGVLTTAASREAVRMAPLNDAADAQAPDPQTKKSGGHPILIGTLVGAAVGALATTVGSSCSVSEEDARLTGADRDAYCGSTAGWAVIGAVVGGGIGAGVGLLIKVWRR